MPFMRHFYQFLVKYSQFGVLLVCHASIAMGAAQVAPWVIDETHLLKPIHAEHINHILANASLARDVNLRLIILKDPKKDSLIEEEINRRLTIFQKEFPTDPNTSFIFIQPSSGRSWIILGEHQVKSASMNECLLDIQDRILAPALADNNLYKAAWEGVTALCSALSDWPAPPISEVQQQTLIHRFFVYCSWLLLIGGGWYYFRRISLSTLRWDPTSLSYLEC